ncbi:MAG TPA: NAD(P)/FAD-dependent oxidoreductase [Ktedonobacterales bacterium]|nr:NAD(P)/FAD-dependent oxidoreductase [Ktedonobacterales bacterium]
MYDAIVVGARCAGSPTAMLLARRGYRVLLVDRATFPSDTFRAHVIRMRGVRSLHRWGLLERVVATNCPPLRRTLMDFGDFPLAGYPPGEGDIPGEYAPRRRVLDALLVEAAVEASAELWDAFTVDDLLTEDGRVCGITGRMANGTRASARARVVVGADGQYSLVARKVGAEHYHARPSLTCAYYSYWSGTGIEGLEIHALPQRRVMLAFQTNDGLSAVAVGWPAEEFHMVRADLEGQFYRALSLVPELEAQVRGGRREEPYRGTADLPNFFRQAYGQGWALVGDASIHRDPAAASGISDAFHDAELLADALDDGFSGRRPLDGALAGYAHQRDTIGLPFFEEACRTAALTPPPPQLLQLRAAIRGNQQAIDLHLGVGRGTVSEEEFRRRMAALAPVPAPARG